MSPPAADDPAHNRVLSDEEEAAGEPASVEELAALGDVDALLDIARVYRAGSATVARDLKKCFEAYSAASLLGNADAEHATALFHLSGGVVPEDVVAAARLFRSAADKGHLPSKVYVANLYELGIHYRADPEKADVWYRNAARAAGPRRSIPSAPR